MRKRSILDVADFFCGAGGNSIGVEAAGGEPILAVNHWDRAVETYGTNHKQAQVVCCDMSAADPRRFPRTTVVVASPGCTVHSPAGGRKRDTPQTSMFEEGLPDAPLDRSRMTMFDLCRWVDYHEPELVIVENVVEARYWRQWPAWWLAMELAGYEGKPLFLNSMFFPPTPQSRDRMYIVWWRTGNRKPDLEFHPPAWCERCEALVDAIQSWKNPTKPYGKYRQQYVYRCPRCAGVVEPGYTPAAAAIDWTIPASRIGDRKRPLAPNTLRRIEAGLRKYGVIDQVVPVNGNLHVREGSSQVRSRRTDAPLRTQTTSQRDALVTMPYLAELRGERGTARGIDEPLSTFCAGGGHHGVVEPPGYIMASYGGPTTPANKQGWVRPADRAPLGTITTWDHHSLLIPYNRTGRAKGSEEPLGTLTTHDRWALVLANCTNNVPRDAHGEPLATICTGDHMYLVVGTSHSKGNGACACPVDSPLPTQTMCQDKALVRAAVSVEDCGFRMLRVKEIGRGMAFPEEYVVLGTQAEQIRLYGNAVTPPVMAWLFARAVETLS